jgi:hypothetical protein
VTNIKFLGLGVTNIWSGWLVLTKYYQEWAVPLTQLDLCFICNTDTLKTIYFANFHSVTKYGIIFWSNSTDSKIVFQLWKKTVNDWQRTCDCFT